MTGPLLPSTKLSIYEGYMADNVDLLQTTCPTGNCEWPIIPTVGVCGACVNTTDEIIVDSGGWCNVSTPTGIKLTGTCMINYEGTKFKVGPGSGRVFSSVPEAPDHSEAPNIIVEFGALGHPPSVSSEAALLTGLAATECALWYCLQAHKISVDEGKLTDSIVSTWSKVNESGGEFIENRPIPFLQPPAELFNLDPNENYSIAQYQMPAVQLYVAKNASGGSVSRYSVMYSSDSDFADGMYSAFDNPVSWIDRFARSMTNDVRSLGDRVYYEDRVDSQSYPSRNALYKGTAKSSQVIVTVR